MNRNWTATLSIVALVSTPVLASEVTTASALDIFHTYTVNSGNVPQGIRLSSLPQSLMISGDSSSSIDSPLATTTDTPNVIIGNPFSMPPVPYTAQRIVVTTVPSGDDIAAASYAVEVTDIDDPDADPFVTSITERTFDNSGGAQINSVQGDSNATANARYSLERGYLFENVSSSLISFNIFGQLDANLLATAVGVGSIARAAAGMYLNFEGEAGVEIAYLALSPYIAGVTDDDTGATVSEQFTAGTQGLSFTAVTAAVSEGEQTDAALDMMFRYRFGISMQAGTSLEMLTGFSQVNGVEYVAPVAPVPLPASLPFMVVSILGLFGLAQRQTSAS